MAVPIGIAITGNKRSRASHLSQFDVASTVALTFFAVARCSRSMRLQRSSKFCDMTVAASASLDSSSRGSRLGGLAGVASR